MNIYGVIVIVGSFLLCDCYSNGSNKVDVVAGEERRPHRHMVVPAFIPPLSLTFSARFNLELFVDVEQS